MPSRQRREPTSKRVAWPEPGHKDGGEFRLTWGRLAAIVATLVGLVGSVPIYWTISDHWMNRAEIQTAMKAHAEHDAGVQQWNQYGFAANRLEYLDDKGAECEAKRLAHPGKLDPADASICARYEVKLKAKTAEAADLKTKAMEATKERP